MEVRRLQAERRQSEAAAGAALGEAQAELADERRQLTPLRDQLNAQERVPPNASPYASPPSAPTVRRPVR